MCVPDLSVLKSAVLGDKQYNLGAIVARRLHHNSVSGDLFGGIYATRVANYLNIPIHGNDMELPPAYLDIMLWFAISLLRGMNSSSSTD